MQPRTHLEVSRQELELWTLEDAETWKEAELFSDCEILVDDDHLLDNDLWLDTDCGDGLSLETLGRLGIRVF